MSRYIHINILSKDIEIYKYLAKDWILETKQSIIHANTTWINLTFILERLIPLTYAN